MKKSLFFLTFIIFPFQVFSQSGNGSAGSPFFGTISTNVQWSVGDPDFGSTVYIGTSSNPDLFINSGGQLTIDPGITVVFTQLVSDLIITGSGVLTAEGTDSDIIKFTKAADKSHWGHISFENPGSVIPIDGTGTFKNCIIEFGRAVTSGTNPDNMGGAIQVNAYDVSIENCHFNDNQSTYGGAIAINLNMNTNITKCIFLSNHSSTAGGAVLLRSGATTVISNSIFESNSCSGSYSGGAVWVSNNTSTIVNCTFAENTSNYSGDAFFSHSSSGTKILNCLFWGSNDQFAGINALPSIINSAFETQKPASAINSIIISDIADDHFIDANSHNFNLKFISPCRDSGTDNYGTPNVVPPADYLGNIRTMTTDIGAFEVQYSLWKTTAGTTDWNTGDNWDGGIPSLTRDVIIPTGASLYPTSSPGPEFTIGSGKQMILEPGARVTLNELTNNGTLKMNAEASGLSSLILNSYTKGAGAVEEIQLRITGGYVGEPELNQGKWHYISSPVQYFPIDPIFTTTTFNLAQWVDGIQGAGSIREGWVAYDGYMYITGGFNSAYEFSDLTPGKGYNLWYNNDTTYTLSGNFNYANVPVTLSFAGDAYTNGYNLLGNPYPSGLDWDYIVENTNYPENTSQAIIFTKDDELYYYTGGVMVPDNGAPGTSPGVIPPMQGFFVKTYSTGNVINLTPDARTHDGIPPRYKGKAEIPLFRLAISENDITDETVVRFAENAKPGIDYTYDAVKMLTNAQKTAIYTSYGTYNFAINGQPFPGAETIVEIPLTVNLITDGNHTISLKQLQALEQYDLYIVDNSTGFSVDLNANSSLAFSSSKGLIKDRFVIKIGNISTGIEDPEKGNSQFNIYNGFGQINIQTLADEWDGITGSVKVMDMSGKTVSDLRRTEFSKTSVTQIEAPDANGLYFIEIKSGVNRFVGKVVIK